MTEDKNLVIETSGLGRRFGSLTAVDNLDLKVPQGNVFGFLGPNGAGKTTTIRLLLGLIRPDVGRVRLFGSDAGRDRIALLGKPELLILDSASTPWLWFGRQTIIFWSFLMLPLFITLETALIGGLEHSGNNWKHPFVQPVPRSAVYTSKLASGMALIALSQLMLFLYILLSGWLLGLLRPDTGLNTAPPAQVILGYAAIAYVSSWLLISLHTYVGIRWKNFVVAMSFGIVMTVAGFLILNSRLANFYPWALPGLILNKLKTGDPCLLQILMGGPAAVIPAVLGGWDFIRRDVL
jgi:hypothetical protein